MDESIRDATSPALLGLNRILAVDGGADALGEELGRGVLVGVGQGYEDAELEDKLDRLVARLAHRLESESGPLLAGLVARVRPEVGLLLREAVRQSLEEAKRSLQGAAAQVLIHQSTALLDALGSSLEQNLERQRPGLDALVGGLARRSRRSSNPLPARPTAWWTTWPAWPTPSSRGFW